jgi:hypothetical protein
MAHHLGWIEGVKVMDHPSGDFLRKPVDRLLVKLAIANGCLMTEIMIPPAWQPWKVAAGWLAAAWRISGSPVVDATDWRKAMVASVVEVKVGHYDTCL